MKIIRYPERKDWGQIVERPHLDVSQLNATVASVLNDVCERGDMAVEEYELKIDKAHLESLSVSKMEIEEAEQTVDKSLYDALKLAHDNIECFHGQQKFRTHQVETAPGVI